MTSAAMARRILSLCVLFFAIFSVGCSEAPAPGPPTDVPLDQALTPTDTAFDTGSDTAIAPPDASPVDALPDASPPDALDSATPVDSVDLEAPLLPDAALPDAALPDAALPEVADSPAIDTSVPSDAGPSAGAPTVRITSPMAGAVLQNFTALSFEYSVPDGLRVAEILRDGAVVGSFGFVNSPIQIDTTTASSGPHTLGLRLTDRRGRSATATVDVNFRNPGFRLRHLRVSAPEYLPGEEVLIDLTYTGSGFTLSADLSSLDSAFAPSRVVLTDLGGGQFRVAYRLSATNSRLPGPYSVAITATDRTSADLGQRVMIPVRLASAPRIPFEFRGAVLDPEAPSEPRDLGDALTPRIDGITGAARISRGGEATLEVSFTPRAGAPIRGLQLSVVGFAGYYTLLVPDGASRATVSFTLPTARVPALAAGSYQVIARAIDSTWTGSASRAYTVMVEDLGRGGGMMVSLAGSVTFEKHMVADVVTCTLVPASIIATVPLLASAEVRVVRMRDGMVLATGRTAPNGSYSLTFTSGAETVRTEVLTRQGLSGSPNLQVIDRAGAAHHAFSAPVAIAPGTSNVADISVNDPRAGAFNIFQVLSQAYDRTIALTVRPLAPLAAQWSQGISSDAGCDPASCYIAPTAMSVARISIAGQITRMAEWDDTVLRHEFGHFVLDRLSRDESPAGDHGPWSFSDPRTAWSEGFASYWGSTVIDNSCYANSSPGGGFTFRVDDTGGGVQLNTSPANSQNGRVSEQVVSGSLWRLSDPGQLLSDDDARYSVFWSIFEYLRVPGPADQGSLGIELVDFLYGWLCAERCHDPEMRAIVVGTYLFNFVSPMAYGYCPAPYVDTGVPPNCISTDAMVLTTSGVVRVRLRDARITRRPVRGSLTSLLAAGITPRAMVRLRASSVRALVTNAGEDTVSLVSMFTNREQEMDTDRNPMTTSPGAPSGVTRIVVGPSPRGIARTADGRFALVAVSGADQVAVIDIDRLALCKRFAVPREPGGAAGPSVPDSVAIEGVVAPRLTRAYVSLIGTASIPGRAVAIIDLARATDCAVMGGEVQGYLTDLGGNPRPAALALNTASTRLAVAGFGNDRVMILDTTTDTVVDLMPGVPSRRFFLTARVPSALAWSSDGTRVFYGHLSGADATRLSGFGTVRIGALATGRDTYDVGVRSGVYSLSLAEDNRWVYVGDSNGNLTALSIDLWDGSPTHILPPFEHTGGCLDASGRATPCPAGPNLGAGVRAIVMP